MAWMTHSIPTHSLFFCFFLSLGGSLRALIISAAALGTTAILACLFCTVSCTVIRRPFHSVVALAMSSPTFFGDCIKKRSVLKDRIQKFIEYFLPIQVAQSWEQVMRWLLLLLPPHEGSLDITRTQQNKHHCTPSHDPEGIVASTTRLLPI